MLALVPLLPKGDKNDYYVMKKNIGFHTIFLINYQYKCFMILYECDTTYAEKHSGVVFFCLFGF